MRADEQAAAFEQRPQWEPPAALPSVPQAPAPQAPQAQKAGIGGEGWNEDFDQAWGNRMMKLYGVSMEDLRDPETRRWLNRQQRKAADTAGASAAKPATTPATTPASSVRSGPKPVSSAAAQAVAFNPSALMDWKQSENARLV